MKNPFAFLADLLKDIGRALVATFGVIKKIVPEEQLLAGIALAKEAAIKFATNQEKRDFVIAALQERFKVPEYIARLIVEMAVAHLKHGIEEAADKAVDAVDTPEGAPV